MIDAKGDETVKDGGPAFPEHISPEGYSAHLGMSLRDWFAGQAVTGIVGDWGLDDADHIAATAYAIADGLLKARGEGQ